MYILLNTVLEFEMALKVQYLFYQNFLYLWQAVE